MNKQLKNIFVPFEIAKLAKQKGFYEWCAFKYGDHLDNGNPVFYGNTDGEGTFLCEYDNGIDNNEDLSIPTHFQLMMWLVEQHHIEVTMKSSGMFKVFEKSGSILWVDNNNEFEINEALEHALNLLPNA